jgi:hypothetical protein
MSTRVAKITPEERAVLAELREAVAAAMEAAIVQLGVIASRREERAARRHRTSA